MKRISILNYRKPFQTNLIIPSNSNHPPRHKMTAFNSLIYRMLRISINDKERNSIKEIE